MKTNRDLVNLAGLGLIAVQTHKLSTIASELAELREAADRKEGRAERLAQMRQMIFLTEELLERLESHPKGTDTSLQRKYVMAYEMEANLKLAGVVPTGLDVWEDKDRLEKLRKKIEMFSEGVLKAMPEDQRAEAMQCVKYMAEEPDLRNLIMVKDKDPAFRFLLLDQKIDVQALNAKFGGIESVEELRTMYWQRRHFVRNMFGPHYLARQEEQECEEESEQLSLPDGMLERADL